jgi:hypothetical protein
MGLDVDVSEEYVVSIFSVLPVSRWFQLFIEFDTEDGSDMFPTARNNIKEDGSLQKKV